MSLHRSALGKAAGDRLTQMGRALGLPAEFSGAIAAALADADIVHLGYEGGSRAIYKIYLEYASRVRRAQAQNAPDPVLVHLAYKWVPGDAGERAITRYTWVPCRSRAAMAERLRAWSRPMRRRGRFATGSRSWGRASERTDPRHLFLMEVAEPDNPRRSYDLNVYRAELHLGDIADLVDAVAEDFAIPPPQVRALFERSGALALGHLAGGRGRDGGEFVTLYFGVEAH